MFRVHIIVLILLIVFLSVSLSFAECWKIKSVVANNNADYSYLSISFCDTVNGLVMGAKGFSSRTTDGGKTWTDYRTTVFQNVIDVAMIDSTHAFAVNSLGSKPLFKTTDGGRVWTQVTSFTDSLLTCIREPSIVARNSFDHSKVTAEGL